MLEYGILSAIAQGFLIRILLPYLGDLRLVIMCVISKICAFILFIFSDVSTNWVPFLSILFFSFGSMSVPSVLAMISRTTDDSQQGKVIAGAEVKKKNFHFFTFFFFFYIFLFFTPLFFQGW